VIFLVDLSKEQFGVLDRRLYAHGPHRCGNAGLCLAHLPQFEEVRDVVSGT